MENPIKMDDFEGIIIFGNTHLGQWNTMPCGDSSCLMLVLVLIVSDSISNLSVIFEDFANQKKQPPKTLGFWLW